MKNHNEKIKKTDSVISDIFTQSPHLEFLSNKEVVIEGSKGVVEYTTQLIRINTSIGLVCFFGRNLNLKCITSSELIINGFITKVEFIV